MAEAVLEVVLQNLSLLLQKQFSLFLGFHQDFKTLSSLLTTIKATLEDAEEKQFTDRAIKDWLQKLKDAAYVLDEILDECATHALELEYQGFNFGFGLSHKVPQTSWLSSFNPKNVAFRYKIVKKMKRIRERLDEIAEERNKFHLTEIVRERRNNNGVLDWRQTTSIITQPKVYGRDEDKDKIIDFLVGDHASSSSSSSGDMLSVYSIVGLGGLGKTTLAQLIFNHERVVNHFELRIWVCVSEDFSLKRMTKAILESASGHACEDLDLEPLQRKLLDLLERKIYLLVLDDVWDDQQENWQRLRSVLACGGKGSSVLVTTRLPKVAQIMGTMHSYHLSMLSDNDCWELFKQRAFGPNEEQQGDLVVIGKDIIKKCGGVPLAAIALGSLLRFKREEKEWIHVKESRLWNLQGENTVMPALRLSYMNLPVKLRQCFAFCALFPKDKIISKQYVIELWMANGMISSNEMLGAEDIGNEVCNELYWRSFFQDVKIDEFGKITTFKMHDLVHDLAQSVAVDICCITNDNGIPNTLERISHLSVYRSLSSGEYDSILLHKVKLLKTCITHLITLPCNILKCPSLRVLEFIGSRKLSSSIGFLKYLRYLDLSSSEFQVLPESLCTLWNLQILKLNACTKLQKLPNSLIRLKSLEHIYLNSCYSLSSMPPQIRMLTSLKTLTMYVVGKKGGFFLAELGQLNLKGDLHIKHLERVKSIMDAKEANMPSKRVNQLRLSWERNGESQVQENVEEIFEALQPHAQQLQTLEVRGYTGANFPQWMSSSSLKHLTSLKLLYCRSLHLPDLGKLPSLKSLKVSNMSHIIYLDEESCNDRGVAGGFITLEFLLLKKLPKLIRLSREDRENMFPQLSKLQITDCPKLLGLPCLPHLNEMGITGKCNQDLLSSIHKLSSLESFCFSYNEELTCFPDGMLRNLTSLKILDINGLSKLEQLPTEMNNLEQLRIFGCDGLESLTEEVLQGFHFLKKMYIGGCQKFHFNLLTGFQYLTCLEELIIDSCPEIEAFPEALQHMASLQSLALCNLPNLVSLPDWLGNLGLLRQIRISMCPKVMFLPTSIRCLTGLKRLHIYSCNELGKRCQKETGQDWENIAHVQSVLIEETRMFFGRSARHDEKKY